VIARCDHWLFLRNHREFQPSIFRLLDDIRHVRLADPALL
jgi:hypothetical protein